MSSSGRMALSNSKHVVPFIPKQKRTGQEDCRKRSLPGLLCAATPPAHTHTHTQERIQENMKGRLMATGSTV